MRFRFKSALGAAALAIGAAASALASPTVVATYDLPAPTAAFSTTGVFGSDGLFYAYNGSHVYKQDGTAGDHTNSFTQLNTSALPVGSDPGPISFTRDGSQIIVGTGAGGFDFPANGGLFYSTSPAGSGFTAAGGGAAVAGTYHFTSLPTDSVLGMSNQLLAVNSGTPSSSQVSYYDLVTGTNTIMIDGIPGASSAVAFDGNGHFYVGVGFGPQRGTIKRFNVTDLDAAYDPNNPSPLDWTTGTTIHDDNDNSGAGIIATSSGYVFVGDGTSGFIVIDPSGVTTSYNVGSAFGFLTYNAALDEFAVVDTDFFSYYTATVYSVSSALPEPAGVCVLLFGAAGLLMRRRVS